MKDIKMTYVEVLRKRLERKREEMDLLQKAIDDTMPSASEKRRYVELKSEIKELESVLDIAEVMLTESPSS